MSQFDENANFVAGRAMRTRVMGDEFVRLALTEVSDFTAALQQHITEHAWGTVWCRDEIDLRTRSLITLAMLAALGRGRELEGHVRGALNNGVSETEIREVLLHCAVYCGVPLAADAFRSAEKALRRKLSASVSDNAGND